MKRLMLALVLVAGCTTIEVPSDSDQPNGYCESDDECDAEDRCWLEREIDTHLVEPGEPDVIVVNRCIPRPLEGDWCEAGWCAAGLTCELADGAARGLCAATQ